MNGRNEQQHLLNDVLAESSPPDFRAALLGQTLRLARARRLRRQRNRVGGILAAAVLAGFVVWQNRPAKMTTSRPPRKISIPKCYQLVETRPLEPAAIVATKSVTGPKTISSEAAVAEVATTSGGFRFINDEELLALFCSRPAMLVRTGPGSEALVFADAATVPADHFQERQSR